MKKVLVSILAVMVTTGAMAACANGDCPCKGDSCKGKKYRVIHVTANNTAPVYGQWEPIIDQPSVEEKSSGKHDVIVVSEPATVIASPNNSTPARRESKAYVGARLDLNLLSMKTKYHSSEPAAIADKSADHDSYSFEPVFGGNVALGLKFTPSWRGEFELGYITKFKDSDEGITFNTSTSYLMGNVMYDFANGLYLGAGVGVALSNVGVEWNKFVPDDKDRTNLSLMGGVMFGYGHRLSDSLVLDLRYRFAAFEGSDVTRVVHDYSVNGNPPFPDFQLNVDLKTVFDNSFSIGLRYEF